jgi:hypothetical protein
MQPRTFRRRGILLLATVPLCYRFPNPPGRLLSRNPYRLDRIHPHKCIRCRVPPCTRCIGKELLELRRNRNALARCRFFPRSLCGDPLGLFCRYRPSTILRLLCPFSYLRFRQELSYARPPIQANIRRIYPILLCRSCEFQLETGRTTSRRRRLKGFRGLALRRPVIYTQRLP